MRLRLASGSISLPGSAGRENLTHLVGISVVKFSSRDRAAAPIRENTEELRVTRLSFGLQMRLGGSAPLPAAA